MVLKFFIAKIIGAAGLILFWLGCLAKAGFFIVFANKFPFSGVLLWTIGAALIFINASIESKLPISRDSEYKQRFHGASNAFLTVGFVAYALSNLFLVSFRGDNLSNKKILFTSICVMLFSLLLIFTHEYIKIASAKRAV